MKHIDDAFPSLKSGGYQVTSEATYDYNCIAWTVGDTENWWWPDSNAYWPSQARRELTVDAFLVAYEGHGFTPCADGEPESDYEKLALYADASGKPTHAARQLEDGSWTSKLGPAEDISHATPFLLEGVHYGRVVRFLRRRRHA